MSLDKETDPHATRPAISNDYRPTPYEESDWEIVGAFVNQENFELIQFDVISERANVVDPMFADFTAPEHTRASERFSPTRHREDSDESREEIPTISLEEHASVLEAARAQAFEEGRASATAEAEAHATATQERYVTVMEDVGLQLNENLREIEKQAVQLAIQISEKLVGTVVEINPEYLLSILHEAIQLTGGASIRAIKVSPQDFEFISLLNLSKQFKEFDGSWNFEADDTVKAGCVVVMAGGEVDYRIDEAWERIKDQVLKIL